MKITAPILSGWVVEEAVGNKHCCRHVSGFSLIELMVVMAIVAILAGMLMPAISSVRQAAWKVQCGSNMRQIGLMASVYGVDNHGLIVPNFIFTQGLPPDWNWNAADTGPSWYHWRFIGQYEPTIDANPDYGSGSNSGRPAGIIAGRRTLFRCPRDTRSVAGPSVSKDSVSYGVNINWSPNIWSNGSFGGAFGPYWDGWGDPKARRTIMQIAQPANAVFMMEAYPGEVLDNLPAADMNVVMSGSYGAGCWRVWVPWHRAGCNILFFDGHVRFSPSPTADDAAGLIDFAP